MAILLKTGVVITGIKPEMVMATMIVASLMEEFGVDTVVTSGDDSAHGEGSLHFSGRALDYRTSELTPDLQVELAETLKAHLGAEFDVVLEADHLHVEHDPEPVSV